MKLRIYRCYRFDNGAILACYAARDEEHAREQLAGDCLEDETDFAEVELYPRGEIERHHNALVRSGGSEQAIADCAAYLDGYASATTMERLSIMLRDLAYGEA